MRPALETKRYYLDPSRKKPWGFYDPNTEENFECPFDDILKLAGSGVFFYVDSIGYDFEHELREGDAEVYRLKYTKLVEEFRKEYDWEKSEVLDAKLLFHIHTEKPEAFRQSTGTTLLVDLNRERHCLVRKSVGFQNLVKSYGRRRAPEWVYEIQGIIEKKQKEVEQSLKEEVKHYPLAKEIGKMRGIGPTAIPWILAPIEMIAGSIYGVHSFATLKHIFGQHLTEVKVNGRKVWRCPSHKIGEDNDYPEYVKADMYNIASVQFIKKDHPYRALIDDETEKQKAKERDSEELENVFSGRGRRYKNYKKDGPYEQIIQGHARGMGYKKAIQRFLRDCVWKPGKRLQAKGVPWRVD